jgi:hypothetical protein
MKTTGTLFDSEFASGGLVKKKIRETMSSLFRFLVKKTFRGRDTAEALPHLSLPCSTD